MPSIHLCLISNNILPNLIPALSDPDIKGVITFSGDGHQNKQRRRLVDMLEAKHISQLKSFNANNSFDFATLYTTALKLVSYLQAHYADHVWKINLTAGTKPMSLAVFQALQGCPQAQFIYQDTQHKMIRTMDESTLPQANASVIDLPSYLLAHNFIMDHNAAEHPDDIEYMQQRRSLINEIFIRNIGRIWLLTTVLNFPASTAADIKKNTSLTQPLPNNKIKKDAVPLLEKLETFGLFQWDRQHQTIHFTNKESATFLAGGWLEEYAYWSAVEAGIEHIGLNVTGKWDQKVTGGEEGNTTNEFDLVLCHHNQLLVVECKALAFNKDTNGQDIVNKIEALGKNLGGLFGKSMLLASDKLTEDSKYTKHIVDRLTSYRIDLVQSSEMRQLSYQFKQWKLSCEPKKPQPVAVSEAQVA